MRKFLLTVPLLLALAACSPRDFLNRRLAADLIAGSEVFTTPQQFWMRTGVVSNKEYTSPEYLVLQRRGWVTATSAPCPAELAPPPCWDANLTPLGVDAFHDLVKNGDSGKQAFTVPVARRELIAINGISKNDNLADVEFTWQWVATSEVGSALIGGNLQYRSTVGFKRYDDGWRVLDAQGAKTGQTLEDALKAAVPTT